MFHLWNKRFHSAFFFAFLATTPKMSAIAKEDKADASVLRGVHVFFFLEREKLQVDNGAN